VAVGDVRGQDVGLPMPEGYQESGTVAGAAQKGSTSAQAAQEAGLPGLTWSRQSQQPSRTKAGEDGVSPEAAVRAEQKNLQWELKKSSKY